MFGPVELTPRSKRGAFSGLRDDARMVLYVLRINRAAFRSVNVIVSLKSFHRDYINTAG